MKETHITGLILAGGQAKRMGSVNKGAVSIDESTPMVSCVINNLTSQVDNIYISANQYSDYFTQFGYPVLQDERKGFQGPLAGIETVLRKDPSIQWLFCSPVDTPFFPTNLVQELLETAQKNNRLCVFPTHNNIRHPLHCLIHSKLLPSLTEFLNSEERSVGYWLRKCNVIEKQIEAPFPAFENINTLEELSKLRTAL